MQGGKRSKRGVYSRPENWEKTILGREGSDVDYEGKKRSKYKARKEEIEREKKAKKARKKIFGKLMSRIVSRD